MPYDWKIGQKCGDYCHATQQVVYVDADVAGSFLEGTHERKRAIACDL